MSDKAALRHDSRQIDKTVGERIRRRRIELGLTQEQLATSLDVSYQQIQKYESGANRISVGRIVMIAQRLDVDVAFFLDSITDMRSPEEGDRGSALGGRSRASIELVRKFSQIDDSEVRGAIAGLVKTVVDRQS